MSKNNVQAKILFFKNQSVPCLNLLSLLSETILELSCRLQDKYCINKVAELWPIAMKPNSVNT